MSEKTTNNRNVKDDEIDLMDLFRRMGRTLTKWFNALIRAFLISVVFLVRRWLPLGLSIVIGLIASYFSEKTSVSQFTADLILRSNTVPSSDLITYINRLKHYNSDEISKALLLNSNESSNLVGIGAYWVIDNRKDQIPDYVDYENKFNLNDTGSVRMSDRLDIRVIIQEPKELNHVRNGIIKFIENDTLFQQKNRLRSKQNFDMLSRVNIDILQLDSLQKVIYFEETRSRKPQNGGQMVFLQEQKTQLLYNDMYALYRKKESLESEINLYGGLTTILNEFTRPLNRDNGIMYYAKDYVPKFLVVTLLGLIILANRKRLLDIYRRY
jgi:hypothetical protein